MIEKLRVKLFGDGADIESIKRLKANPLVAGFTTNPTLMRKAGVTDYREFAREVLVEITDKPVSFEVLSDDFREMEAQAREIASWAHNVYVKIPITNTRQESSVPLIERLTAFGVKMNITAICTLEQMKAVLPAMRHAESGFVSIFAGRIADAGVDPEPIMIQAVELLREYPKLELLWASPRELFNVIQADRIGCHVITLTDDVWKKLPLLGKNLDQFSLETVQMFYNDAVAAKYELTPSINFAPPQTQPISFAP